MAITLSNADSALKSCYLDVIADQLNYKANPLLARINQTSNDVWGKEIRKMTTFGINGGVGAGTEDGNLPSATGNNYSQMVLPLKNLYGTIEISDKAIRASENNAGAFVSLLNAEMDGLIKSSSINFARMLFGDGTGELAKVASISSGVVTVNNVDYIVEGMVVDFRTSAGVLIEGATGRRVISINRTTKAVTISGTTLTTDTVPATSIMTVQGSYNNEITGLGAIFGSSASLYGLTRASNPWLNPVKNTSTGSLTESKIQKVIDNLDKETGSKVNLIICSYGVRRSLVSNYVETRVPNSSENISGGYQGITFNGIPVVVDRFCPSGTMYLLNTDDFELHQLCDWQWLEGDDGKILKQVPGKPVYTATLVKYADLLCTRPCGQAVMTGITEA